MIFKDLKILKEKENRIFLIFVIWMLFSLILNYIIPFITLIIALPLLSYSCMLFIYTASKEKDILNMNFKEYIIVFSMSIILGVLPLIVYFINVFIYLITVLIMFLVSLIMYIFIPRFHRKETYLCSLWSLILFGLIAASFSFFLLFFPSYIMYKCYKGTHKLENKLSNSNYSKIWYLIQLVCGIVLGFVILAASKVTLSILNNNYGKKKRVWIRRGDLVIVNPWEWATETQDKLGKCEISWRYTRAEISWLERNRKIPQILELDNISF